MAMNTPQRRLAAREHERERDRAGNRAAWAFVWTLFAFKIATIGIIYYAATSTHSVELNFIYATTWYWLAIPAVAISGSVLYRWRLIGMRRRRQQLRDQEWMQHGSRTHEPPPVTTIDDMIAQHHRKSA